MENFVQFCKNMTMTNIPDISEKTTDIGNLMKLKIDTISKDIKLRLHCLDRVSIPYVESMFEDIDVVVDRLNSLEDSDVNDAILNRFANNIYRKDFNELSSVERSIISVLGIYILI